MYLKSANEMNMLPQRSIGLFFFSVFLLFLSSLRLWDKDLFGFCIFVLLSCSFFSAYQAELKRTKTMNKTKERKKIFFNLSAPRIISKIEGESEITTLIVPSLELFNEVNNDRNISN